MTLNVCVMLDLLFNLNIFIQIAREHGIRFMETSAKANINIESAFYELAQAILTKTCGREQTEMVDRVPLEGGRNDRQSNRCC